MADKPRGRRVDSPEPRERWPACRKRTFLLLWDLVEDQRAGFRGLQRAIRFQEVRGMEAFGMDEDVMEVAKS